MSYTSDGCPVRRRLVRPGPKPGDSTEPEIHRLRENLVDYFDPADEEDALAKIERPLLEPAFLATREAQARAEYRRRTWNDCG
jgi:hypothetical protein